MDIYSSPRIGAGREKTTFKGSTACEQAVYENTGEIGHLGAVRKEVAIRRREQQARINRLSQVGVCVATSASYPVDVALPCQVYSFIVPPLVREAC